METSNGVGYWTVFIISARTAVALADNVASFPRARGSDARRDGMGLAKRLEIGVRASLGRRRVKPPGAARPQFAPTPSIRP
jgi:hypothetical protein